MKGKRVIALLSASLMAFSLAGCGGAAASTATTSTAAASTATASAAASGTATAATGVQGANTDPLNTKTTDESITIGLASEPSALWGAAVGKTENEGQIISAALLDTLVTVGHSTGEVVPNLATAWEWVDGTHCKFTLRDDVTMYGGAKLTSKDVIYSIGVWTTASANTDTGRYIDATQCSADDDKTVTIGFNATAPDLTSMLAWSNFGIVSEADVTAAGGLEAAAKNPLVGSGKYKFKEWKAGQSVTLERNESYWNPDYKGYYKTIVFTFTNDAAARAMAVQSGDAQVANDMPVSQAATFAANPDVKTFLYTFGQNAHLWYNMKDGKTTSDQKVREAIDKALDFDALAQVGTAGFGKSALGYFTEDTTKYYNATYTADERKVDVEGAKKLLEEAGYKDGLELTCIGTQDTVPMYTVIQENLRAVGITLTINTLDIPQFVQDSNGGNYDIIIVGELSDARYPTLMGFMRQNNIDTFCIGGPKVTTPELDNAIGAAIEEKDEAKAKTELGDVEKTMKDSMIESNLYPEMHAVVAAKDIMGLRTNERGFLDATSFYKA